MDYSPRAPPQCWTSPREWSPETWLLAPHSECAADMNTGEKWANKVTSYALFHVSYCPGNRAPKDINFTHIITEPLQHRHFHTPSH